MSTAVAHSHAEVDPAESPLTPESWGKLGMWTFLAADAMSFGGLLAAYGALRYSDPTWPRPSSILGIQLTAFMTFLLVCTSVTMVEGLAAIRQGNRQKFARFIGLTVLGGIMFLGLQAYEWNKLIFHEGQSIQKNLFGATFFLTTGFHGMHVFAGVVLPVGDPHPRADGEVLAREQQRGRDRGVVLALRRSDLDPRLHVHLPRVTTRSGGD